MNTFLYQLFRAVHFLESESASKSCFMQDNAPIHVTRSTQAWFSRHRIALLPWPANSPNLNPMENVWDFMARKIYEQKKRFRGAQKLRKAIIEAWHQVDQELIDSPYLSLSHSIFEVIRRNDGPTDY